MRFRVTFVLAAALLLAGAPSHAALSAYTQNFEGLVQADPAALSNDGWLVYGNVFTPAHVYMYGYGAFPAPNGGTAFSNIDVGQGGVEQGAQQLSVFSDYNNLDHANGNWIESNVFHEMIVDPADVGTNWVFQFDAKLGNLIAPSTAIAFLKTLNPAAGWATTNFITIDMTAIPTTWGTFQIPFTITAGLVGQHLQFGYASTATNYISSAVFYDNISFTQNTTGVGGAPQSGLLVLQPAAPNPFSGSTTLQYSTPGRGVVDVSIYDVAGRRIATLVHGEVGAGPHAASWNGRTADGGLAPAGIYRAVLRTDAGRQSRNLVLSR